MFLNFKLKNNLAVIKNFILANVVFFNYISDIMNYGSLWLRGTKMLKDFSDINGIPYAKALV